MTALSLPQPFTQPWPADEVDPSARVPHPPSDAERARRRPTPLWQVLLLAALLHLWLALLLGSVPPGSAQPGQGVWGAINLRLQAPGDGPAPRDAEPQPPLPATGPPGDAPATRWGGAVRAQSPAVADEPGAARLGDWAPVPALGAPAPALVPLPPVPQAAQALERLPSLPALADRPEPPRLQAPPAAAAPVQAALPVIPLAPAAVAPSIPSLPLPEAMVAPLARLPSPPVAAPATALAPLAGIAPAAVAQERLTLPDLPVLQAPDPVLLAAPRLAAPIAAMAPLAGQAPSLASPPALAAPSSAEMLPLAAVVPAVPAEPGISGMPGMPGSPDAGARAGVDVATPPSAPASAPRLNLNLPRSRGGELSRLGSAGVLAVMPRPPELKSKLAREIESAAPRDCRTAHAQLGLLAVVPLAVDALSKEGGCRW